MLDYLKSQVEAVKNEEDHQRLLEISRQTLTDAEERLASKEQELSQLQSDCEAIADEMQVAAKRVQETETFYREALANFQALAAKHQSRWQELNPNQELYQQLGRIEFPAFVVTGVSGKLMTSAIARDLR